MEFGDGIGEAVAEEFSRDRLLRRENRMGCVIMAAFGIDGG